MRYQMCSSIETPINIPAAQVTGLTVDHKRIQLTVSWPHADGFSTQDMSSIIARVCRMRLDPVNIDEVDFAHFDTNEIPSEPTP